MQYIYAYNPKHVSPVYRTTSNGLEQLTQLGAWVQVEGLPDKPYSVLEFSTLSDLCTYLIRSRCGQARLFSHVILGILYPKKDKIFHYRYA